MKAVSPKHREVCQEMIQEHLRSMNEGGGRLDADPGPEDFYTGEDVRAAIVAGLFECDRSRVDLLNLNRKHPLALPFVRENDRFLRRLERFYQDSLLRPGWCD